MALVPVYGDWLSDITTGIKNAIPSNTIVGKLVGGDVSGAVTGAANLATSAGSHTQATPTAVAGAQAPASASIFAPGGVVDRYKIPLLVAAAGLLGVLIWQRQKRKK